MEIRHLALQGFRNFELERLELPGKRIFFVGRNGQGKTNLLEAVSLLSPGRGLRREEVTIEVLETTKTGSHDVWPFPPTWIEEFGLREVNLPEIETDLQKTTLQRIGQQVTLQFRRYEIPFAPYDLRHAWAVRTILMGLPDTVAARMMGHSVAIHNRTYHRWITRRDQQRAVNAALGS